MFDNIGGKIKKVAEVVCWMGIIVCCVVGVAFLSLGANGDNGVQAIIGVAIGVVGSLLSWVSSFVLYGFGQLVENSDVLVQQKSKGIKKIQQRKIKFDGLSDDSYIDILCPKCNEQLSFTKREFTDNETLTCPMCDEQINTFAYK